MTVTEVVIGFLEEDHNVRSMSRLVILLLTCGLLACVATVCTIAVGPGPDRPLVIGALGAVIATLAGGIFGALKARHVPPDTP